LAKGINVLVLWQKQYYLIQFINPRISQITLRNNKVVKFVTFLLNSWNTPSDPTATIHSFHSWLQFSQGTFTLIQFTNYSLLGTI